MTFTGVFVPLITPFDTNGGIAFGALETLAQEVLEAGATGIVALGTTAEPASLSPAEQQAVVEVLARVCRAHGAQLLVGANTIEALRRLPDGSAALPSAPDASAALRPVPDASAAMRRLADGSVALPSAPDASAALRPVPDASATLWPVPDASAAMRPVPDASAAYPRLPEVSAALTLVPPFVRPGEAGVVAHFAALAEASPVPLIVYHVPYRTGQHLTADTIRRLAALPGIVGIKHAVGGIDAETVALLADPPTGLAVLGGDDPFISPMLALGAHGGVLASAHIATARFVELVEAWRAGDAVRARELGHRLAALSRALFAEPNPTVIKGVLYEHGRIPTAAVRLPLVPASTETVQTACQAVGQALQRSLPAVLEPRPAVLEPRPASLSRGRRP